MSYCCALHKEYSVYIMASPMPYPMWFEVRKKVERVNIYGMLAQSYGAMRVGVMKSTINHPMARIGFCQFEAWEEKCCWGLHCDAVLLEVVW